MSTTEYSDVFEERRQALTTKLPSEIELCKRSMDAIQVEEFIPIPKRKKEVIKQFNTTVMKKTDNTPQLRQIIEVHEKIIVDRDKEFIPIPKRKKSANRNSLKSTNGSQLKNEVKSEKSIDNKKDELVITKITNSIRSKLAKCWNIPASMAYKENFSIKINLLLSHQGEIIMADVVDNNSYQDNSLFRSVADSAMRAIYKCSPLTDLPSEHYHIWREITLDFILNGQNSF